MAKYLIHAVDARLLSSEGCYLFLATLKNGPCIFVTLRVSNAEGEPIIDELFKGGPVSIDLTEPDVVDTDVLPL